MGKKIGDAKIGVVWHTRYTGESLDKIQANYNVKIAELNQIPQVFMTDPYIPSFAGIVTFTEEESEYFKQFIEKIDKTSKTLIFNPEYQKILDNNEFVSLFTIFQNSLIKNNIRVDSPAVFIDKFKEFLINRFQKEINVKKSENSKAILVEKLSNFINLIENNKVVYNITSLILEITKVKHMFIEKLNNIGKFETFLQTRSKKYITTGDEGFAVSDMHGNIVKLVDRYEFSYANFSPNILKGWTK
jgi:hypothetical protein